MDPNLTPQYRAQIFIPGSKSLVTITGSNPQDVQGPVSVLLRNKARFEPQGKSNTILVFSTEHFEGKQPVGWIADYEVPMEMSTAALTEHRLSVQRAA